MFQKFILDYKTNLFEQLSISTELENITNGRKGTNLIECKNGLISLVRTTTIYNNPSHHFLPIHYDIIESIKKIFNPNLQLNNALHSLA